MKRWKPATVCVIRRLAACALMFALGCCCDAQAKAPPEWLKPLLAEDAAEFGRGSDAVRLLDFSHVTHMPDQRVRRVQRGVVRVLTAQGKVHAACAYAFNANVEKVVAARAWTLSPDGTRVEGDWSQRDFVDVALKVGAVFWPQQRVLSHGAAARVKVGGVFAWEFEVESKAGIADINWTPATDLPLLRAVLEVTPVAGGRLLWHATHPSFEPPEAGASPGALRWMLERKAAFSTEEEKPPGFMPASRVLSVRAVPPNGADPLSSWSELASLAATLIEPRIVVTPEIQAKAEALVAGKTARWDRIRALAEFTQREITYLAVILDKDYLAGYRPHEAGEVLRNRYGDCKDKATLFAALMRAVGEAGHVVLVAAGNPRAVYPDWPSACFNHAIAGVPADAVVPVGWPVVEAGPLGRLVLFDPTDPNTPLGMLPAGDQGGFGLVAAKGTTGLVSLPFDDAKATRHEMTIGAQFDADGTLQAEVTEEAWGRVAVLQHVTRENLRQERYTANLEARLRESLTLVEALRWKDAWEPEEARWLLNYQFAAPRYVRRTAGNLMLLNPLVVLSKLELPAWKTKQEGVVLSPSLQLRRTVRLKLPAGSTIEELPEDWSGKAAAAECRLTCRLDGQALLCEFELVQRGGFQDKDAYEGLRQLYQQVREAEKRPALIRRAVSGAR